MTKLNYSKKHKYVFNYENKNGILWGYRYPYYDKLHKRREIQKRGSSNESEAYKQLLKNQLEIEINIVKNKNLTVEQWSKIFVESNKPNWKISTYKIYIRCLNNQIIPLLGNIKLSDLTKSIYQSRFVNKMVEKGYKRNSILNTHARIMTIINAAVDEDIISRNKLSRTHIPDTGHIEKRIMTKEELKKFNEQLDK